MNAVGSSPDPLEQIRRVGIVPVVTIDDADDAVPLVEALAAAGLTAVEITLRTPAALDAIRHAASGVPGATVGVGTVTSRAQAAAAIDAGARFVVSPGLHDDVIAAALERDVVALPGVATPTELMRAVEMGVTTVKLFPAELIGGVGLVRALSAVFPAVRFVPTGGISATTAAGHLGEPSVLAVGGSWMLDRRAVAERRWGDIRIAARAASALAEGRP